ncbi:MAG: CIA30 family protein [Pseudomonadota bacterium]
MLELDWTFGADTVMGGVSEGAVHTEADAARPTGTVSLENNGGFIQMASAAPGLDGAGLRFDARGDGGGYILSLRTTALSRPWQSFRFGFTAPQDWTGVELRWSEMQPHRTEAPFDPAEVRRIGILAVGTARTVDVSVRAMGVWS